MWVTSWPRRTDKVKAPGFEEESRARKEPSKPRSRSSDSASTPEMAWWNHLEREKISNQWFIVRRRSHASLHSAPLGNKEMLSRENIKRVTPMLIHFMRLQLMAFFQPDTESSLGNKFFILFYKLSSSSANERRGREWESCDGIFFIFFFRSKNWKAENELHLHRIVIDGPTQIRETEKARNLCCKRSSSCCTYPTLAFKLGITLHRSEAPITLEWGKKCTNFSFPKLFSVATSNLVTCGEVSAAETRDILSAAHGMTD